MPERLSNEGLKKNLNGRWRNFLNNHSVKIGLGVVGVGFFLAAWISWRKWPDVLVDFGTQLYMPWRISEGDVLYRDLFYFAGGPFSQYFNAELFKIFGVSFLTLIVANLTIVVLMLLVIYRRFLSVSDAWTATTICLGIVLVFALSHYAKVGNYNFIAPYSHEALHGLVISIFGVVLLSNWVMKERKLFAAAAGFCSGVVFLTKPDIFVALMACVFAAFVLFCITRSRFKFALKSMALFLCAGLLPTLLFFLCFLGVEGWRASLHSIFFAWMPLLQGAVLKNQYYRWCVGLDRPLFHLGEMAIHLFMVGFFVLLYAIVLRFNQSKPTKQQYTVLLITISPLFILINSFGWFTGETSLSLPSMALVIALFALVLGCALFLKSKRPQFEWLVVLTLIAPLLILVSSYDWLDCGTSLPMLCFTCCVLLGWNYKKLSTKGQDVVFPFLWTVFSLALMSKLGLFPRIWNYGVILAMPAFVSAVYLLFWLLPMLLEDKFRVPARFARGTVWLTLMIGFVSLFIGSISAYAVKNQAVGSGKDKILTFAHPGEQIEAALSWIETNVPTNATLAAIPEGIAINYLTRRINPTPCIFWEPNVMSVFGQKKMTAAFAERPPDYILIVERSHHEFGVGYFGHFPGYGVELMDWIEKNYIAVHLIGKEPLRDGSFGIKILKRLPSHDVIQVDKARG